MQCQNCFYMTVNAAKAMALRHDPSLQTRQKAIHVYRVYYTFEQIHEIMELSGINDGNIHGHLPPGWISYSKDKFFLDPSTKEPHPKDPSKYIMSHRGWDSCEQTKHSSTRSPMMVIDP